MHRFADNFTKNKILSEEKPSQKTENFPYMAPALKV
jgi:hypothetical protein